MNHSRRQFLSKAGAVMLAASALPSRIQSSEARGRTKRALFDGKTLKGWHAIPRLEPGPLLREGNIPAAELSQRTLDYFRARPDLKAVLEHKGKWEVIDGAIVGAQDPPGSGLGAYLITDETFEDFELEVEVRPDFPIDSGILVRQHPVGPVCYQVQVDYRRNGGLGGFFTNNTGGFRAPGFYMDADELPGFRATNLREGVHDGRPMVRPHYGCTFAEFAKVWRLDDWNSYRIRCVGRIPTITCWINGLKTGEMDFTRVDFPGYDAEVVYERIGRAGHIGLEVHPNDPAVGRNRWAPGAVCRWRNIQIQEL